jgi:hypothetical protein
MAVLDIRGAIIGETSMAIKAPCLVATTGTNITLSGVQTIDGVTVGNNNERVLVKDQTNQTQNAIYQAATGSWTLTTDFSGSPPSVGLGTLVLVTSGTINQSTIFEQTCTDNPIVIGTSLIAFTPLPNATAQATTSTTIAAIGTGTQNFSVRSGLAFSATQWVLIQETSNSANQMLGQITSYSRTSLVVDVVATAGSGTHSDWTIVLTNSPAAAGYQPPIGTGNVTGPGSATLGDIAIFSGTSGKLLADGGALGTLAALSEITAQQLTSTAIAIGGAMLNGTVVPSVTSNALTLTIETLRGNTPSAADPVFFVFQPNPSSGAYAVVAVESALSITVPSGSTVGFSNAAPGRFWVVAIDNSGTVSLAVINCLSGTNVFPLQGQGTCNVTAFGGGGNSAQVFYGVSSIASVPYSVLGAVTYETGNTLATAGSWSAVPSSVILYRAGLALPGQPIQRAASSTTTQSSATSSSFGALSPNIGANITPLSSVDLVRVSMSFSPVNDGAGTTNTFQVARGSTLIGVPQANWTSISSGSLIQPMTLTAWDFPASQSSVTYSLYTKVAGGTTDVGGSAAGTTTGIQIEIEEIAA